MLEDQNNSELWWCAQEEQLGHSLFHHVDGSQMQRCGHRGSVGPGRADVLRVGHSVEQAVEMLQ